MRNIRMPGRKIPVVLGKDVVVVGGGVTGIATAIAAARNGAKTVLIERDARVGGCVSLLMPLLGFRDIHGKQTIFGIADEIVQRMKKQGYATDHFRDPCVYSITSVDYDMFSTVAMEMLEEEKVDQLVINILVDVIEKKNDRIKTVAVANKNGLEAIEGRFFIDASGDADLAARAGVPFEKSSQMMPAGLWFSVSGVDVEKWIRVVAKHPEIYEPEFCEPDKWGKAGQWTFAGLRTLVLKAEKESGIPAYDKRPSICSMFGPGELLMAVPRVDSVDGTNARDLERAELEARKQIKGLILFAQKYLPGFENCYLSRVAYRNGIRESRRIVGEYMVTEEDIMSSRRFDDKIAVGGYVIDDEDTFEHKFPPDNYDIPYRMLLPKKIDNLLVAGRCASASHIAMRATRMMPTCMAMGQAAGTAAALCVKENTIPCKLDIKLLQKTLAEQGQYLGEQQMHYVSNN